MPLVTVEGPAIKDLEKKKTLAREITDAAVKAYNFPKEHIVVLIKENLPENVSVGGQLVSEMKE
ncbi:tautomerase family protein [bacterium]|nr:tautomerase family protein [bacterium]